MAKKHHHQVNSKVEKNTQGTHDNRSLYMVFVLYVVLLTLSINDIGYNFLKSLTGEGRFSDFTLSIYYSPVFFDPRILDVQPPFDYAMTPPLALFFRTIGWSYWGFVLVGLNLFSLLIIGIFLKKLVTIKASFGLILLSCFPLFFCIMRGSADLWLLALLTMFYHYYQENSKLTASILLGLLIACKPHFAAFALIFWVRKDIKSMFTTLFSFVSIFLGSLLINTNFSLSDQLRVIVRLGQNYQNTYAINDGGLMWDNGLIGLQKIAYYTIFQPDKERAVGFGELASTAQFLTALFLLMLVLVAYWGGDVKLQEVWLISTILFVFLSPVSATYRLIFFIPVLCYYFYARCDQKILILILLLWLPKGFIWAKTSHGTEFVGDSLVNPIVILLMFLHLVIPRLKMRLGPRDKGHNDF